MEKIIVAKSNTQVWHINTMYNLSVTTPPGLAIATGGLDFSFSAILFCHSADTELTSMIVFHIHFWSGPLEIITILSIAIAKFVN